MSSKIDGVPRKLIERVADHCKFWIDHPYLEAISDIEPELRALLAAPVVERQEWNGPFGVGHGAAETVVERQPDSEIRHAAVKSLHDTMQAVPCSSLYSLAEAVLDAGYAAPPGLAELQATIAQLETKLNNAINLDFERRAEIERLTAKNEYLTSLVCGCDRCGGWQEDSADIERLKGEPVAWCNKANLEALKEKGYCQIWLGKMTSMDDPIGIFTSQPAPVSVSDKYDDVLIPFVAMMRAELHANAGKGDRPGWLAMDRKTALLEIFYHVGKLQKAVKNGDKAGIGEYAADVANMSMMLADVCACLDKVKELNQ